MAVFLPFISHSVAFRLKMFPTLKFGILLRFRHNLFPWVLLFLLSMPIVGAQLSHHYQLIDLDVPLNRSNANKEKFTLKYKMFRGFFDPNSADSPILLCVCGQQNLQECYAKMQILEEFAPRLEAAIVYMEHRFYGEDKMPTIKFDSIESLAHLDVIEALEDIRSVVDDVAQKLAIWGQTPINRTVVVGADYAGALALWLNLQKDKMPPKITWAASPSPLLLINLGHENKSLASFDQHLTDLMAKFGCDERSLRAIFQWMDETARGEGQNGQNGQNGGLDTVTGVLHYFNGIREKDKDPIETVKEMALLWLRKFATERNAANFVKEKAKLVWPLEELCESVSKASDGKAKATAFGQFIVLNEPTAKMGQIDYRMALDGSADKDRWTAKMFQQCTQMPLQICASGVPKDAFYKQCPGGEKQRLTERCEHELAAIGFNETERQLIKWDFVADTFGFDLNSVRNLIITFDQFDPLAMINSLDPTNSNKTAGQIPFRSDSSRHFYVFPSIGLSTRAREMDVPNSCDPMALKQARTQIIDILQCLVHPDKCLFKSDQWPFPLAEQDRQSFASNHSECQKRLWHYYPWASYNGNSEPAPNSSAGSDASGRGRAVGWAFWMGIVAMLATAIQIYK